jgi:hypothetical protein
MPVTERYEHFNLQDSCEEKRIKRKTKQWEQDLIIGIDRVYD